MALFKSLADKIQKKKDELQAKAAERAAEIAIERGKRAALDAAAGARKKIEEALFGDGEEEEEKPSKKPTPKSKREAEPAKKPPPKDDAVKAALAKERARKLEKDVDDDLAALKKRIAKGK